MSLLILLAQCVCMFIASFAVGSLPLMFKSSTQRSRIKAVSTLGMGLLVGAALTIIIPEGVSTVYGALPETDDEHHDESTTRAIGLALLAGFALMLLIESLMPHPPDTPPSSPLSSPDRPSLDDSPSGSIHSHERRPYPVHVNSSTPIVQKKRMHIEEGNGGDRQASSFAHGLNATLGLVIHGAADGIALGASSLSGNGSLGLVVFLAVLVHKGPTALGLTTTLMSLNLTPPQIRRRLLIFSFAAPLGAVITFFLVKLFGVSGQHNAGEIDSLGWWTGIALLFSGGSFLYVATVIQPLSNDAHAQGSHSSGHAPHEDSVELGKYQRTALLIVGMLGPVVLSMIVGDAH